MRRRACLLFLEKGQMKLLVSVSVLILASAAIPSHEIKSLPGWDAPLKSKHILSQKKTVMGKREGVMKSNPVL